MLYLTMAGGFSSNRLEYRFHIVGISIKNQTHGQSSYPF